MNKSLKELIQAETGKSLSISGDFGASIDKPIVIHRDGINDYIGIEYFILDFLYNRLGLSWKIIRQKLMDSNDRMFDQITLEIKQVADGKIITKTEDRYFDITDCLRKNTMTEDVFDENVTLEKIRMRILELENVNDFNKTCVGLLKKGKLTNNKALVSEFEFVLIKDEALSLFKRMYSETFKTMGEVLRMIEKRFKKENKT